MTSASVLKNEISKTKINNQIKIGSRIRNIFYFCFVVFLEIRIRCLRIILPLISTLQPRGGGGGDLVSTLPGCVCRKGKDMGPFSASSE